MEPPCDYCGVLRALVYCKSDLAKLCLNCDVCVHSANPLSRRHPRSLICDKCASQPAVIRCLDEKVPLYQGCHWTGLNCSDLGHRLQGLNPYSGCPSMAEFTRMWTSVLEPSSSGSGFGSGWIGPLAGSLPLKENCTSSCMDQRDHNNGALGLVKLNDLDGWIGSSSSSQNPSYPRNLRDQSSFFSEESNLPKGCSDLDLNLQDCDDICEGLNMVDAPLNFDAGEDILGCSQGHNKYNHLEDPGPVCVLVEKNSSVTESNCPVENALEASSSGQQDCISYQSSRVDRSASNLMQPMNGNGNAVIMSSTCSRSINVGLPPPPLAPTGQVHPSMSLSLSNITGESRATDYQDCGLSPGFLMGNSPWESNLESCNPQARDRAKLRYNQKKSKRVFGKQIRYASRKARADTRKRVKGRFVKAETFLWTIKGSDQSSTGKISAVLGYKDLHFESRDYRGKFHKETRTRRFDTTRSISKP